MTPARDGLHARIAGRLPEITDAVLRRCAAEVPFYGRLPEEVIEGEVRRSVEASVLFFLRMLRPGHGPGAGEVTEVVAWSARRAAERVPLEAALAAHLVGAEVLWRALAETTAGDAAGLDAAGDALLRHIRHMIPAVALAHLEEQQRGQAEAREAHRALVDALLAGRPALALAEAAGVPLAPSHLVVVVRPDGPPVPGGTARRLQSALDGLTGTKVLTALDATGGTVLLPSAPGSTGLDMAGLPDLLARLGEAVGRPLVAAAAVAEDHGAVAAGAAEAGRVMDIVRRLGRPPGLYRFEDVVLEYQLARPGPGLAVLAAKLDRLAERPELMDTLRAFVRHGHNRSRTAKDLHVHRNTLDYRLRKVAALTGLDPGVPGGARLLDAAVIAQDLLP
ncbi:MULTISPECIES: PucR family transcriptional regulator [Thermomonosporaceae]|uniref:PucR family transcriptional regulator n=1 Tax=Thermomonosporaceae TaxID=2012 RepID=UPI00255A7D41|nr:MULTISPECIES: helix-turn-helix domain-containing protein [Thermomonosporaceae]MDL4774471.1 helix-turn-helix domain-containing protein [Actinomadura xylanilytica]